jgi:hypothetical protein
MKKFLIIAAFLIVAGVVLMLKPPAFLIKKPPIVDYFACGDYCPGPTEQYMVNVYQGVTDQKECERIGGRFSQYTGWGTHTFCLAE